MNKSLSDRFSSLLTVKSIVTIVLTAVFAYLSATETISGSDFLTVFLMVVSFYFGTQTEKKSTVQPGGGDAK